jgi:hypothetical protein
LNKRRFAALQHHKPQTARPDYSAILLSYGYLHSLWQSSAARTEKSHGHGHAQRKSSPPAARTHRVKERECQAQQASQPAPSPSPEPATTPLHPSSIEHSFLTREHEKLQGPQRRGEDRWLPENISSTSAHDVRSRRHDGY